MELGLYVHIPLACAWSQIHNLVSFRSSLGLTVAGAVITEAEVAAGANTSSDNGSLNSNLQVRDKTFLILRL